uniref:Reverse transcriptase Ty1/copia-type domain-containing protein n=1 Tax=Salix viminalis TaxID=40686 RepID=A0A6N2K1Z3_SALVM
MELVAIFQDIDCRSASQVGTVDDVFHLHSAMARLQAHIFLNDLDPSLEQIHAICTANDITSLVIGEGSIILTNTITRDPVIIIPSLVYNLLLEVQKIKGYTYSDWTGNQTDRRLTLGYFMFVEGNLVTWRSMKQKVVARSSTEVEYRGMIHGVCELLWIKQVLQDLGIDHGTSMGLHCDNETTIKIVHNYVQHDCTKHVEIRVLVEDKEIVDSLMGGKHRKAGKFALSGCLSCTQTKYGVLKDRLGHTTIDFGIAPQKLASYQNGDIKNTDPLERLQSMRANIYMIRMFILQIQNSKWNGLLIQELKAQQKK